VIALDAIEPSPSPADETEPPSFADASAHLLEGALVDPLVEDVRTLARVNALIRADGEAREAEGHRTIPYIFIAPAHRNAIGEVADRVYRERFGGLKWARSPELVALTHLLGGPGSSNGALISLVLFDEAFIEELIAMGRADAQRWLAAARGPDAPWHTGPIERAPREMIAR
jgi:NTE family protein